MVLAARAEKNAVAIMNNVTQRICRQLGFHTTTIEFRAILEHRGLSYGVYNLKNIAVLPQYRVNVNKQFRLGKDSLNLEGKVGYFNNFSFDERLTIYNLDIEATLARLKFKKWNLHVIHIGDLQQSIGLNIGDALHSSLFRVNNWSSLNLKLGISHALFDMADQFYQNVDFSIAVYQKEDFRVYTQWSYRYSTLAFHKNADLDENLAAILGFKINYQAKKTTLSHRIEARYYGKFYNTFLKTTDVHYRERTPTYGNTTGPNLYPLYRFDRPFGQWAVYNEYNSDALMAGSAELDYLRQIAKFVKLRVTLDMHVIVPREMQVFAFAFYECGAQFILPQDYLLFAGISNKGMNLDKHYPTHYVFMEPVVQIKFSKDLADFDRTK
ncbi:MAG: hypothetical protein ACYC1Q_05360 [Bacteroidia bacterium]